MKSSIPKFFFWRREGSFETSTVYRGDESYIVADDRTSTSASIRRHSTPIVKCLEERFAAFQGGIAINMIEPLQVVKYTPGQQVSVESRFTTWSLPKTLL